MPNHQPSAQAFAAILIDSHGTTALHQAAKEGTLQNLSGVTATFLATVKTKTGAMRLLTCACAHAPKELPAGTAQFIEFKGHYNGPTPLHYAATHGHLDQILGVTAAFLATIKDNDGVTPLHKAAANGHLDQVPGVTAAFLATVKDNDGRTALHTAAWLGHLDQIPGVTAEFLATVKDNHGNTLLDHAASYGHLDQIPDLTITLATTLGLLNAALRPENIAAFTEDFRCHGAHYNHCPTVSTALLKAANQLPDLSPTQRTAIKTALSAAQEGGFVLPSEVLASLL